MTKCIRGYVLILCVVTVLITGCRFFPLSDTEFAKSVFTGLVKGRQSVEKDIDWPTFKAMGVDVGESYKKYLDEKQKTRYRRVLIRNLSFSFHTAGGKAELFRNWRVEASQDQKVTVATDAGRATLLLFITKEQGKRKLTGIEWLKK